MPPRCRSCCTTAPVRSARSCGTSPPWMVQRWPQHGPRSPPRPGPPWRQCHARTWPPSCLPAARRDPGLVPTGGGHRWVRNRTPTCGQQATRAGGEHFVDPDRLPHVLAGWEVAALRVLHASPPSVRDLAGVAHAEQALLVHTMVILNAAAEAGVIDHDGFTRRIRPRLQDAHLASDDVAASWPAQMHTPAPAALLGVEASAQLHQGLADITRDGTGWATPALIAQRVHLAEVTGLLRDALGAGRARAGRFAELPSELARAGQIRAPARLLAAMDPHPGRRGLARW